MTGTATDSASPSEVSVRVARLACHVTLPRGRPAAPTVDRLRRGLERAMPRACAAALGGRLDGEAVYRIRRLRLRLTVDASELEPLAGNRIDARWGTLLARAVVTALERPGGAEVVRFPSPAAFLAAFVRDLLAGHGFHRWCFRGLRPLEPLGAVGAAVHALAAQPAHAAEALVLLDRDEIAERLIRRLDGRQAERLLDALTAPASAAASGSRQRVGPPAVSRDLERTHGDAARARDRLRLALALARTDPPRLRAAGTVAELDRLADVARLLAAEPDLGPLLAMRTPLDAALRARVARHADWLPELAARDPDAAARLVEAAAATPGSTVLRSENGAAGLILPALADDPAAPWATWRATFGDRRARELVFVCLLKTVGRRRSLLALGDPLLAALAGLDQPPVADARLPAAEDDGPDDQRDAAWAAPPSPEPDADELAHLALAGVGFPWLSPALDQALSSVVARAIRATAARLPRMDRAGIRYLARTFLAQAAILRPRDHAWELALLGGPASFLLHAADLPETCPLPWLDRPLRLRLPELPGGPS